MHHKMSVLVLITFSFYLLTCKNNPVDGDDNFEPGRRDYTWTIDTLKVPEGSSNPSRMWGTDENNIWAVGSSYLNGYCLWHYNGNEWINYDPKIYWEPYAIYGTAKDNIWIGTTDGSFWHYDGQKWSKFCIVTIPDHKSFICQNMCGNGRNNIYAVGFADNLHNQDYMAVIFHYDGKQWKQMDIPIIKASFIEIGYDAFNTAFYLTAEDFMTGEDYLYQIKDNKLELLYKQTKFFSMGRINDRVYIVINRIVYTIENKRLIEFKDFSDTKFMSRVIGRNNSDFFTANLDGLGHFNGSDLVTIYPKQNDYWSLNNGITFEHEIFFIWNFNLNIIILHGKLN